MTDETQPMVPIGRVYFDPRYLIAVAVFGSFLVYYGLCCFRAHWGADFQMYCAGVARLYRDFFHPGHEAMSAPASQSTVYTPYLVLVAALGRLIAASPFRALQLAGLLNLAIYAVAILYFFSRCSMHRNTGLAAAVFLLVSLFLRWDHFGWSSETNVLTMQLVQAYPSTIAWAMAFIAFGLVEDLRRARRPLLFAALTLLLCLLLLTHVATASWVMGVVLLRGLHVFAVERSWRFPALLAACAGAAVLLGLAWPWSPFVGQTSMAEARGPSSLGENPFADLFNLYLVAVPCAAWLLVRFRQHVFVVIGFAATFAALQLWRALDVETGNHYSFFMGFWAQFVVAEAVTAGLLAIPGELDESNTDLRPDRARPWIDRPVALFLLVAAGLSWLPSPMWREASQRPTARLAPPPELLSRPSPHDAYYAQFGRLAARLGPRDLVLTPTSPEVFDLASVTGARVLSAPNAQGVPDADARAADVELFFSDAATAEQRLAIARRRCPTAILIAAESSLRSVLAETFGPPVEQDDRHVLYGVGRDRCEAAGD
jgi:hypothetical protein